MRKILKVVAPVLLISLAIAGCGGGVNENKPVAEIKTEAQAMDASQLQAMVDRYKKAIEAKRAELEKIQAKLKEIPVTELLGDEAKAIKTEVEKITKSIRALGERYNVYVAELSRKK